MIKQRPWILTTVDSADMSLCSLLLLLEEWRQNTEQDGQREERAQGRRQGQELRDLIGWEMDYREECGDDVMGCCEGVIHIRCSDCKR